MTLLRAATAKWTSRNNSGMLHDRSMQLSPMSKTWLWSRRAVALNVLVVGGALYAANKITDISITTPKDLFPESITSLKDGTIILGSVPGGVFKIKPGETTATPLVPKANNGFTTVLGVFADEKA